MCNRLHFWSVESVLFAPLLAALLEVAKAVLNSQKAVSGISAGPFYGNGTAVKPNFLKTSVGDF